MSRVTVSDHALRELVREILDNKELGLVLISETDEREERINVSDIVDPSAALTDPSNSNFRPQNRIELQVAVKSMIDDLSNKEVPDVYEKIASALDIPQDDGDEMKTKDTKVEAAIRQDVRKHIRDRIDLPEAYAEKKFGPIVGPLPPVKKIPSGVHGAEYMQGIAKAKEDLRIRLGSETYDDFGGGEVDDDVDDLEKRKFSTMTDVGGASFQEIAKELGFSVAGAKQAVDKAMLKAQWMGMMQEKHPEDLEIIVLSSMNDYIKQLAKTGELSHADIQLMKDHPEVVRELDGFREFLDKAIRKARKGGTLENPLGEAKK